MEYRVENDKLFRILDDVSNFPPDFMEDLKKMEIVYSYPKKINKNKY